MEKLLILASALAVMSGIALADPGKSNGAQEPRAKGPVKLSEAEMEKITASGYNYVATPSGINFIEHQGSALTTTENAACCPSVGGVVIITTPGGTNISPVNNSSVYHVTNAAPPQ